MEIEIKELNHLGIIAGVIKDLNLINNIDERIQSDKNNLEYISPGEAIAGMILNSLGFMGKSLSLTSTFFQNKALELLFRPGVESKHFNRHKLGHTLDKIFEYGSDKLFYELAELACKAEGIDTRFNSLDTTTISLTGEYVNSYAENFTVVKVQTIEEYNIFLKRWYKEYCTDILFIFHEHWIAFLRGDTNYISQELKDGEFEIFTNLLNKIDEDNSYEELSQALRSNKLFEDYNYYNMTDNVVKIDHGYSKDLRSDLKQLVCELMVTQDGGIPLLMKAWDGNASDSTIFKERTKELMQTFSKAEFERYLVADSKLYSEANAMNLKGINFITRIPGSIKLEQEIINKAISVNEWKSLGQDNKYHTIKVEHYGINQRWIVVESKTAKSKAKDKVNKLISKELNQITKKLVKLNRLNFSCRKDAVLALEELAKEFKYHNFNPAIEEVKHYTNRGRPKENAEESINYRITASITLDEKVETYLMQQHSCFVLGTNIDEEKIDDETIIQKYKAQNSSIENMGFRFIKDKIFFADSLFLKSPHRIMALIMVMTLSLLIYSITQRKMRNYLEKHNEILPANINEITFANNTAEVIPNLKEKRVKYKHKIYQPTIRWLFQLLDGINQVKVNIDQTVQTTIQGITELREKIVKCFGKTVMNIYGLIKNVDFEKVSCSM